MMQFKNIKYLFWDNDGVLVDTEKLYFRATKEIFEREGFTLSKEMFVENVLKQSCGAWFILEDKGYSKESIDDLKNERNNLYNKFLQEEEILIKGVVETLERLSKKFLMAIVTSSWFEHFNTIHKRTGILNYFEFFLTREDYNKSKPDPEPYLAALKKAGVTNSEVIVIEDSERGLAAAFSAGLECIIIKSSLSEGGDFKKAKKILNSPAELTDYLLKEH